MTQETNTTATGSGAASRTNATAAEGNFRALLDAAVDAIIVIDHAGDLYGSRLRLELVARLRETRAYVAKTRREGALDLP